MTSKKKAILASAGTIGKLYLTKLGIVVLVTEITKTGVKVVPEFSSKLLTVKLDSLLFPCPKKRLKKKGRDHFDFHLKKMHEKTRLTPARNQTSAKQGNISIHKKAPSKPTARRGPKGPQSDSVRSFLDPLIIEGLYTIKEMADKLAGAPIAKLLRNKDLRWYVSDRMYGLKKAGYKVQKLENGAIKAAPSAILGAPSSVEPLSMPYEGTDGAPAEPAPSSLLSRLRRLGSREI